MSAHSSGLTSGAKDKVQSSHPQWQPLEEQVSHECRMRNDRQSYFKVVRELVRAQFELGDGELTARLWKDIADRDLDRGRIIHLLYGCGDLHHNDEVMRLSDEAYVALVNPLAP